jgi:hypothetical protein
LDQTHLNHMIGHFFDPWPSLTYMYWFHMGHHVL